MKTAFFAYVPFTGLGLYGGFRGNRWLKNRIKIFKQFVIPSLLNQTDRDFILWVSWRPEERQNPYVKELEEWLHKETNLLVVFTYGGVCFYDDKYEHEKALSRLALAIHFSIPDLLTFLSDATEVIMMIQPSDDLYFEGAVKDFKRALFAGYQAASYQKGFMCNYRTKELREYNPSTNPPFFAYRMPKEVFIDPQAHLNYTGPYQSHEYIGDKMVLNKFTGRGFLVGTHGENISTYFDNPFGGEHIVDGVKEAVLKAFGIDSAEALKLPWSLRKWLMRIMGHKLRRKIRFWLGERFYSPLYNYLRN